MGACGHGGLGGLSDEFARKLELALVFEDLQEQLVVPPSREVFLEEHARLSAEAGRRLPYRAVLQGILARTAPL